VRAIALAEGRVLSIIDTKAVTYTRAWCMLEMNHALDLYPLAPFDIYTACPGAAAYDMTTFDEIKAAVGKEGLRGSAWLAEVYRRMPIVRDRIAVGLTSGPCNADCGEPIAQTLRQECFPLDMLMGGLDFRMQNMQATVETDLAMIFNFIAHRPDTDEKGEPNTPLAESAEYEKMNNNVRGFFAASSWKLLIGRDEDHAKCTSRLAVSGIHELAISFRGCAVFTDIEAHVLAGALPKALEEVRLEFTQSGCTSEGGNTVFGAVFTRINIANVRRRRPRHCLRTRLRPTSPHTQPTPIRTLWLVTHPAHTHPHLVACMTWQVRVLEMSDCLLTCAIPDAIGEMASLTHLTLAGNKMTGPIPAALGRCSKLRDMRCQNNCFEGPLPPEFGDCTALTLVRLNGNKLSGTLPETLSKLTELFELRIQFNQLVAPVPQSMSLCTKLITLAVDEPVLEGLPEEMVRRRETGELYVNKPR
jgi:hypothetical protein